MKTKVNIALSAIAFALLVLYPLAYVVLSLNGRYEPAGIGSGGVKFYGWAPCGFYEEEHGWNRSTGCIFAPLVWSDWHLWHTPDKALSGDYPVTKVAPEDIWEYYVKWESTEPINPEDSE